MGIYDLRKIYGKNKKANQAINSAIRAEIPGGGRLLNLTYETHQNLMTMPEDVQTAVLPIYHELTFIRQEMLNWIAQKYELASYTGKYFYENENETGESSHPR